MIGQLPKATNQSLKRRYKIFCVGGPKSNSPVGDPGCDWEVKVLSHDSLWLKRATCPKCEGNTDAVQLK